METRNITITLEKAIELYNSGNESLKDLALQAFSKKDLMSNFRDITTFKKACDVLGHNYDDIISKINSIAEISRASAAMFKLNIIRKALNFWSGFTSCRRPRIHLPLLSLQSICD